MTSPLVIIGTLSRKTGEYVKHDPPLPLELSRKPVQSEDWMSNEMRRQRDKYENARRTL